MSEQLNIRAPKSTIEQIKDLQEWTEMTQTQIVIQAVDRLHRDYKEEQRKQGGQGDASTQRS